MICAALALATSAITIEIPCEPADRALEMLGEQVGLEMKPSGAVKKDVIYLKVEGKPLEQVMEALALATEGEWRQKGETYYLRSDISEIKWREEWILASAKNFAVDGLETRDQILELVERDSYSDARQRPRLRTGLAEPNTRFLAEFMAAHARQLALIAPGEFAIFGHGQDEPINQDFLAQASARHARRLDAWRHVAIVIPSFENEEHVLQFVEWPLAKDVRIEVESRLDGINLTLVQESENSISETSLPAWVGGLGRVLPLKYPSLPINWAGAPADLETHPRRVNDWNSEVPSRNSASLTLARLLTNAEQAEPLQVMFAPVMRSVAEAEGGNLCLVVPDVLAAKAEFVGERSPDLGHWVSHLSEALSMGGQVRRAELEGIAVLRHDLNFARLARIPRAEVAAAVADILEEGRPTIPILARHSWIFRTDNYRLASLELPIRAIWGKVEADDSGQSVLDIYQKLTPRERSLATGASGLSFKLGAARPELRSLLTKMALKGERVGRSSRRRSTDTVLAKPATVAEAHTWEVKIAHKVFDHDFRANTESIAGSESLSLSFISPEGYFGPMVAIPIYATP